MALLSRKWNWELTTPWIEAKIQVPVRFMTGDFDMVYTTPGIKEYIHGGGFAVDIPNLQEIVVIEDVGHFVYQEKPQEVSAHINDFFTKLLNNNKSFLGSCLLLLCCLSNQFGSCMCCFEKIMNNKIWHYEDQCVYEHTVRTENCRFHNGF